MLQLLRKSRLKWRLSAMRTARRLSRRQDGAAAVEFGLVAFPFVLLMFAIMETAFVFFAGQSLETAVSDTGRLIMTGQAQNQGFDQAAFKQAVCNQTQGLFDTSKIKVDVKKYTTFSGVDLTPPLDADGKLQDNQTYQPGGPSEIVVVRLYYQWPIYVSMLENMAGNGRLLVATSAFRNEPYAATN
jgi:Flp pilus assembly protein TadG